MSIYDYDNDFAYYKANVETILNTMKKYAKI